ncbi:MAG TPA: GNAT family protein [Trichocoleus sp.]
MTPALSLKPTQPQDLAFVLAAENHLDNRPYIHPWSQERHLEAIHSEDEAHFLLVAEDTTQDARPVGYLILQGLTSPHRSLEMRRLVVTEKGQGYGRTALRLIQAFAFETRQAHRLWLDVKVHNQRAKRLYEQAGFVLEGCLRECLKTEQGYESLYLMSQLRSEYFQQLPSTGSAPL